MVTVTVTLYNAVTLTSDLLTLKVCGTSCVTWLKSVRSLSEIEQSPTDLFIIWQFLPPLRHTVTLTSDPLTLNFCNISGVMCPNLVENWVKSNNLRLSYWRFWRGPKAPNSSQNRTSPNLERTYSRHLCSPCLFQISDILLHFEMRAAQRRVVSEIEAKFRTFWPLQKLGEDVGRPKCDIRNNLARDKELNIVAYGTPFYVIIYRSYILKNGPVFIGPPCKIRYLASAGEQWKTNKHKKIKNDSRQVNNWYRLSALITINYTVQTLNIL